MDANLSKNYGKVKKNTENKEYDYSYLDGLRGIGAFSVYLWHFWEKYVTSGALKPSEVSPFL
jgi:peptidoglycan/LPS O-acetylase OafA/YrhL